MRRLCLTAALAGAAWASPLAAAPVKPLTMEEIAPGVFVHEGRLETFSPENAGDVCNVGFVVGEKGVAVIDAGGSFLVGAALKAAIRARTDKPILYLVVTHMHPDHTLGAPAVIEKGVTKIIGHARLARALDARREGYLSANRLLLGEAAFEGSDILAPDEAVETTKELDLGGRVLTLEAHPTAHTDNDLTARDSRTDVWFLGDLLFMGHTPALDGSLKGWLALMEAFKERKAAAVAPGHGPAKAQWPSAMTAQKAYLDELSRETRFAIERGDTLRETMDAAARKDPGAWRLFREFHARNVAAAYQELEWD